MSAVVWAETYGTCDGCGKPDVPLFVPMPDGVYDEDDPHICKDCQPRWTALVEVRVVAGVYPPAR